MTFLRTLAFGLILTAACGTSDGPDALESPHAATTAMPAGDAASVGDAGSATPTKPFACDEGSRAGAAGDRELKLTLADKKERTVFVHVPSLYNPTKGMPLIVAFHGYGGNAEQMREQTGFDAESGKRGFITAYVQGTGLAQKGFNAGDCCGQPAWQADTDDVGLAREIVKKLSEEYCVDPSRIHNAGFSNGGFMSYRLVCEASDLFASVASVSGVLGVPPEACKPTRPVPIVHIHGTNDKTVSYEGGGAAGGLGSLVGIKFRSVAESVEALRKAFTCKETSRPITTQGAEDTRCEEWSGCGEDAAIELCTVTDGGHQWPGGKPTPVGGKTSSFPATKTILDFFDAHPMKR